jgi:hypothetical protein
VVKEGRQMNEIITSFEGEFGIQKEGRAFTPTAPLFCWTWVHDTIAAACTQKVVIIF